MSIAYACMDYNSYNGFVNLFKMHEWSLIKAKNLQFHKQ